MRYEKSETLLNSALQVIPNGTGTFSKSRYSYPFGISPYFADHAKGSHIWDVDGNEYVDFVSGLCPIILGYADDDVDKAVIEQMKKGSIFSLPSKLEIEVAELLCHYIPCAEMVRFGLNGSDATTGAVRLARAYTNREHVACCGYHGWHDWYIGTTGRRAGVPLSTCELTHSFKFNDLTSLMDIFDRYYNQVACVILEPMMAEWPKGGFLEGVKELCDQNKAVLIFDEVITGFRWSMGGAQKVFGVTPDLACVGKAMANGYPISAVVGNREIMKVIEKTHYSFTFSGTCTGLAATRETLYKLEETKALDSIHRMGGILVMGLKEIIQRHSANVELSGHPARSVIKFPREANKWVFLQEMFKRGILIQDAHNLTYSHSGNDIMKLLDIYDEVIPILDTEEFKGQKYESNFKVRS